MEQLVALAGRAFQLFAAKLQACLLGVVAAEIHRLAHLVDAILQRLAGFHRTQRHQLGTVFFQQIAETLEHRRAALHGCRVPGRPVGGQPLDRLACLLGAGELGLADDLVQVIGQRTSDGVPAGFARLSPARPAIDDRGKVDRRWPVRSIVVGRSC